MTEQVTSEDKALRRAQLLSEREILERVAVGAPLSETLVAIAHMVEALGDHVIATILLVDSEGRLHIGAAPSMPRWFNEGIEGEPIGPRAGSCGTAIYLRRTVTTPDIAHDPLWEGYRELAARAGLAACWSTPLMSRDGVVLGTLAHYYRTPQDPTPRDLKLTDIARHLAEIAIQHDRAITALHESHQQLEQRVEERSRELQASERLLQESQRLAHLGSWGWDVKNDVVRWTDELYRIYGLEPQGFGATFKAYLAQIHPDDRDRVRRTIEQSLETFAPFAFEERIVRPSGEERWLSSRGRVELDESGVVTHLWGTCHDITDAKQAEAERAAIERVAHEAQIQAAAAQEAARLKTMFVDVISHDLRTPLTAILGFLEFIEDGTGGPVTEEQHELLRGVFSNTRRLQRLVDDLLDTARIGAGTFMLRCQPTPLETVIAEVVESLQPQAESAKVAIVVEPPPGGAIAKIDPQRIEQVVANLLTNALKFAPTGSDVRVAITLPPGRVRVSVSDSGSGIAPEEQALLFRPFSQLESGKRLGGTGLGLAIAKDLVVAHGGDIGVESHPGHGTTFWFELPRASDAPIDT